VCRYASERIGLGYDFKNIINLMRYLFPWPVPRRWRRRMIALGSGDPRSRASRARRRGAKSRIIARCVSEEGPRIDRMEWTHNKNHMVMKILEQ
jgi:hypothetical protein